MAAKSTRRSRSYPQDGKILFREEQRYLKPRILYIVSLSVAILIIDLVVILQILLGKEQGDQMNPEQTKFLVIIAFVIGITTVVLPYILLRLRLITLVTENELKVSYPPLIRKVKRIGRTQIKRYEKRLYRPRIEYGGYRPKRRRNPYRRKRFGDAYIAYGKSGIQFYLSNRQKLLIGTQRSAAFIHALDKMMNPTVSKGQKKTTQQNKYNHG